MLRNISRSSQKISLRFLSQHLITRPDELRPEAKKNFDDVEEFIKEVASLEEAFMAHSEQDGPEKWHIWQPIEVKIFDLFKVQIQFSINILKISN